MLPPPTPAPRSRAWCATSEVLAAPILDEQPDLNGRLEQAPALPQGATLADPAARQRLTVLVQAFARAGLLDAPRLEEPARQAQAP